MFEEFSIYYFGLGKTIKFLKSFGSNTGEVLSHESISKSYEFVKLRLKSSEV